MNNSDFNDNSNNYFNNTNNINSNPPIGFSENENKSTNKPKKKMGCFLSGFIAILIFITANFFIFSSLMKSVISTPFTGSEESEITLFNDYVEIIKVEGVIGSDNTDFYGSPIGYQHSATLEKIDYLISDDLNKGIILYINSGGGGVYESDELYLTLLKYKEETGRPVYAYYGQSAASGALYISMAADEIYSNRMTMTGSIGVIFSMYDATEFMNKLGIKETTITSGENKNMFSSTTASTEEQQQIIQSMIDESYEIFIQIIADSRGIPLEEVRALADGRIYTAAQSLELNLIDGIYTYDEFIEYMTTLEEFRYCDFYEEEYNDNSLFSDLLFNAIGSEQNEINVLIDMLDNSNTNPLSYE